MLCSDILIIFLKYPQPGRVKTRLAKDIGKRNAAALYRLFVELILAKTTDKRFKRIIFFTPRSKEKAVKNWLGGNLEFYPQKGKNLGTRLADAFQTAFKKGAKRVVVIGTDSPLLDQKLILQAFKELKNKSCLIGPSRDGGYYLLGLSEFKRDFFRNIDWGTDKVLKQTLNIVNKLKLKFSVLEIGFDVDEINDLALLK